MDISYDYFTDDELKMVGYSFFLSLYPDSTTYNINYILDRVERLAKEMPDYLEQYAYICHDKDDDTKPHYHLAIKFKYQKSLQTVLKQFQLWHYNPNNNEVIIHSWKGALNYLIHNTKDTKDKYQYPESKVISNIPDVINNLRRHKDKNDIFWEIYEYIMNFPGYDIKYANVVEFVKSHDNSYLDVFLKSSNNITFSRLIKEKQTGSL